MAKTIKELQEETTNLLSEYSINEYIVEATALFKPIGVDYKDIMQRIINPTHDLVVELDLDNSADKHNLSDATTEKLMKLRKKYKYDLYVRTGKRIRDGFLKHRKNNLFNHLELSAKGHKLSPIEKVSLDFYREHLLALAIDKALRTVLGQTVMVTFEDNLSGDIKQMKIKYNKSYFDQEEITAPLIDRSIGTNMFDSFFLHGFYNVDAKAWDYIPVALIQKIDGIDKAVLLEGIQNAAI
jgi:hypothetical protein